MYTVATAIARVLNASSDESGATGVEYALMLAAVAMTIFLAVTAFGIAVRNLFERVPAL